MYGLVSSVVLIGQTLVSMVSFAAVLVTFSPGLTLLAVAVGVAFGFVDWRYAKERYRLSADLVKLRRRLSVLRGLLVSAASAYEMMRPAAFGRIRERMLSGSYEARDREYALERRTGRHRALLGSAEVVVGYGVYALLLSRMLRGGITLGDIILYRSAFSMLSTGVQTIGRAISSLVQSDLQLQHLVEFLRAGEEDKAPQPAGELRFPERLVRGIRVRDLHFRYPNMDRPVFKGLNLELRPGEVTAVVGENGAGKSTLLKVLAGVYPVSDGAVELEGRPLADYAMTDYVCRVCLWGVGSIVHPLSVRDNVALHRFESRSEDPEIWEALRLAGADEVVAKLPDGIETMLTRALDGGQQLSWGQNMRIIVARALFARAAVLLIDEPAMGLDTGARASLLRLLRDLRHDRIVVVASHDTDVLAVADRKLELLRGGPTWRGVGEQLHSL